MLLTIIELIGGIALVLMTLRDVFETVVVPGGSKAALKVTQRLMFGLLPLWKRLSRPGRGISGTFAPFVLVASFVVWMALLAIGFGLIAYALRFSFDPRPASLPDAIYFVASALFTIGEGGATVTGSARWVLIAAAFCGLAVITMAVTYLLEVQNSVSKRDIGVFELNTSAGDPPSAIVLLERYARLGTRDELGHVLTNARDWCATVRQSHASHPSLIYFRSVHTGSGWPAALGALLDLALIEEFILDQPHARGLAILLRADGTRMVEDLAQVVDLKPRPMGISSEMLDQLTARLAGAGYGLNDSLDLDAISDARRSYSGWVDAMAAHLGNPTAPLLPPAAAPRPVDQEVLDSTQSA